MSDYDVVVAGGGHNGLVCGAYLTLHGLKVLVAERNAWVGGGAVTEEIVLPGFKHDLFGANHIWCHANPDFSEVLRPELAGFFEEDVRRIRERYGPFVLVNSNFGMVNAFLDTFNVFKKSTARGAEPEPGTAARGTSLEFARGYAAPSGGRFQFCRWRTSI